MTIKVDLSDIDKAIREIELYEQSLNRKLEKLQERLAGLGINEASVNFAKAQYDGNNDVTVDQRFRWIDDNTLTINASGSTILFIEFGAGVHYSADPHPQAAEFGYSRGTYGYKLGRFDTWRYEGNPGTNGREDPKHPGYILTHGNPANRCMYDASKEMREQILKIAKEVFATND